MEDKGGEEDRGGDGDVGDVAEKLECEAGYEDGREDERGCGNGRDGGGDGGRDATVGVGSLYSHSSHFGDLIALNLSTG